LGDLNAETAPAGFAWHNPVEVRFGWQALAQLPAIVAGRSVALVLFPEAGALGLRRRLESLLPRIVQLIDDIPLNPDFSHVAAQHRRFWRDGAAADLIVAVGGGSVLDTAKCLSIDTEDGLAGALDPAHPSTSRRPIVAVPTTAGTGSEVTPWATLWAADETPPRKLSLHRAETWPQIALVDPELSLTLPRAATVAGALDALSHALEAIWNRNANPVSDRLAVAAARLVLASLPAVLAAPDDRSGRMALARAATLAGLAFSNTKTALAHEISYALTLRKGITHGIACSAPLPLVWRLVQGRDAARDAVLSEVFACDAAQGAGRLEGFLNGLEVATELCSYGFAVAEVEDILQRARSGARGRNFIGFPPPGEG